MKTCIHFTRNNSELRKNKCADRKSRYAPPTKAASCWPLCTTFGCLFPWIVTHLCILELHNVLFKFVELPPRPAVPQHRPSLFTLRARNVVILTRFQSSDQSNKRSKRSDPKRLKPNVDDKLQELPNLGREETEKISRSAFLLLYLYCEQSWNKIITVRGKGIYLWVFSAGYRGI